MASLERFWATVLTYITKVGRRRREETIEIQRRPLYIFIVLVTTLLYQRWSYDGSCKQLGLDRHFTSVHLGSFGPQPTKHT